MDGFGWDPFDSIINYGQLRIVDPGPLHAPVKSFKLRRDERLQLILETHVMSNAVSTAPKHPSGTVVIGTQKIRLTDGFSLDVVMSGVEPVKYATTTNYEHGTQELLETSQVHYVEAIFPTGEIAKYTIDWLENVDRGFVWPHTIKYERATAETQWIYLDSAGLTVTGKDINEGTGRYCVRFSAAGIDMFLCAAWLDAEEGRVSPGCLIYVGAPDEEFRKRIRNALSFSLGIFLIHMGSTVFSDDWSIMSLKSVSPYCIDRKVFNLPAQPPAPLGPKFQNEVTPDSLSRMVDAIYRTYDEFEFGDLNWGYWHALCATPHIAPVHFGAAIEALQRRYMESRPNQLPTKIIGDRETWKALSDVVNDAISKLNLSDADKTTIRDNVGGLNQLPHRILTERLLDYIGVQLSKDESQAWKRRNDAAHGNSMKPGTELEVIRDMKLLRVVFTRIFLKVTNASEFYYDYASLNFPIRRLDEPPTAAK